MTAITTLAWVYTGPLAGSIPALSNDQGQELVDGGNSNFGNLNDPNQWQLQPVQADGEDLGIPQSGNDTDTDDNFLTFPELAFSLDGGTTFSDAAEHVAANPTTTTITYNGTTHRLELYMSILEDGNAVVFAQSGQLNGSGPLDPDIWDTIAAQPGNNGEIDPALLTVSGPVAWANAADSEIETLGVDRFDGTFVCFAAGTRIATPAGEMPVETLQIGDLVLTEEHGAQPVTWVGRQTVVRRFAGARARPVRIAAHALGDGAPHTDLVLTTDHALVVDGLLIDAGALVNGTTVTLEPLAQVPAKATYYHVETERHATLRANGAPAETYVDYIGRAAFDNYQDYVDLYGPDRTITEMDLPRIAAARLVPAHIRARLAGRHTA